MPKTGCNIYKRKDGRWEGRKKLDGKRYSSFYGKTYREVKNKMEQAQPPAAVCRVPKTMDGLCAFWLDLQKPRLKESSYAKYRNSIEKYIVPFFRHREWKTIENGDIARFAAFLNASLARKTVTDILCLLKGVLAFAGANVTYKHYAENKTPKKIQTLSQEDVGKILQKAFSAPAPLTSGIALDVCTGLRLGELCALKWSDIDLKNGTLAVSRTLQRIQVYGESRKTKIVETAPKSGCSARVIPLPDPLWHLLISLQPEDRESYLLTGTRAYMEPRRLQYFYKKFLRAIGVPYVHFHALRHTFATNCVASGCDVKCLSELLGHSSVHITLDTYVHPSLDSKRAHMRQFAETFRTAFTPLS